MEWFISEPSLCEMKHGAMSLAHHRHDTSCTPDDDDEDLGLARNSSLRRNMMIRPITSKNPSGRIVARLTRASESEMNFHMLEKAQGEKETKKTKSKMSLRNSLKNIFSIKKRYRSGGKSRNSETSTTTASSALASLATATSTSTSNACCGGGAGLGATKSSTTISTATATANYRVVYTDGGGSLSSEQRVALMQNASNLSGGCIVSAGTSFTASTTNINNICTGGGGSGGQGHHITSTSTSRNMNGSSSNNASCCSSELKALGISPLLQYLHRMPSYLELIMFSVRETTV